MIGTGDLSSPEIGAGANRDLGSKILAKIVAS